MTAAVIDPADFLAEAEVQSRWAELLKPNEIRRARRRREIGFYDCLTGPRYTAADVQAYLDSKYRREPQTCAEPAPMPSPVLNSADTTSPAPTLTEEAAGTPAGMTPELARSAAEALARQISTRPRSGSPRSSRQPPRPPKGARPRLLVS